VCRLAYPVVQLQTWELNPASRLMRPGRAPARLQCVNSGDGGIRTHTFSVLSGATPAGWSTSPCRTSNQRLVGESNPYPQVDTLGSWPLDERAVSVPRVGIVPTFPARAAALQAAWRLTARPKALFPRLGSSTGGSRTHTPRGLSSVAMPVRVPCRQQSDQ